MTNIRQAKISDLTPDPNNANQGTERGGYMVRRSLEKLGAGRSVLIDKNGVLIAGNKTTEAAFELGLEDAIIVPTDGSKLVVVQRTDLDLSTDAKAKELAIADNRTSEVGLSWDNAVLESLAQDVSLDDWFTAEDMAGWDATPPDGEEIDLDHEALWAGMPEFESGQRAEKTIYVHFEAMSDFYEFQSLINQKIPDGKKSIWFPEKLPEDNGHYE